MKKKSKIVIARVMAVLMMLSILPVDTWGTANVVKAEELEESAEVDYAETAEADYEEIAEADYAETDSGIKVHNFTTDGVTSGEFYNVSGSLANTTKTIEKLELEFTKGLKLESSAGYIKFETESSGDLLMVVDSKKDAPIVDVDGNPYNVTDNLVTISNLPIGNHTVSKGSKGTSDTYVCYISFTPTGSAAPKPPTAEPDSGEIESGAKVKLSAAEGDAIRYTLDTSVELSATTGTEYEIGSEGITINPPATLKAIAVRTEDNVTAISREAVFTYTPILADAPVLSPDSPASGSAVEKGTVVTISAAGAEAIKYTLDGSDPTGSGATTVGEESVDVTINQAVTIKAVAIRGGVAGKTLEASYTILTVAKPVANKTGRVEAGTEITISSSTAGAEIYYTMGANPADPTTDSELHGASPVTVTINEATTIKAVAVKDKYDNSEVATFNYTIIDGSLIKTYVLDADAIHEKTGKTYSYKEPTVIEETENYFTAMANNNKGASLNVIANMSSSTTGNYFDKLSWSGVDIGEREYAVAITGGGMEVNDGTPKVVVNAIKFTTEAYATGVVYYALKEKSSSARTFKIQSGSDTSLGSTALSADGGDNTKVLKAEFTLPVPGTYYVGFSGSGGIVPYMEVTEDYTIEPEKAPETILTKTITVNDSTQTIIDADFNGDVSLVNAADFEASDAVNILLNVQSIGADNEAVTTGIQNKVAEETETLRLESGTVTVPQAYYYNLSLADKDTNNALQLDGGSIKFQVSYDKLGMTHSDTLVVLQGKYVIEESQITRDKKSGSFWVEADDFRSPFVFIVNKADALEPGEIEISDSYGYEEGAAAEWKDYTEAEFDGYAAYVSTTPTFPNNSKTQRIDNELIREYKDYWRVDTVGLKAGTYYIKIDAVKVDDENQPAEVVASNITGPLTVTNYDRSGFAFSKDSKWKTASGAYNDDGTLREGAQVIYVTADTAKTCTAMIHHDGANKPATEYTGLQAILAAKEKVGAQDDILDIRIIGLVTDKDMDDLLSNEGLQVKGKNDSGEMMNVTIEGIGEDATVQGFGFLIRNCGNVEFRNFGIMAFMDDGVSLDTDNDNIWIHDLDIFYGSTGGDSDQAKGDGSVDIKGSTYVTVSYNHFWDSGKSSLCGMEKVTDPEFKVTYHHNWFDHSDSRHPRIRRGSVHVYNNYFDGNSKYGVGTTNASNAFVEANYFRNVKYPMMISKQGTDAKGDGTFSGEVGGMIKAYNNKIETPRSLVYANSAEGGATDPANATQFDAYLASTRDELVPDEYVTVAGGTKYNNFDTSYDLGVNPANIDNPGNVKAIVTAKAGRLNGGDFERNAGYPSLTGSNADTDDSVDSVLKSAVVNYKSSVVSIGGINGVATSASGSTSGTVIVSSSVSAPVPSQPAGNYTSAIDITLSSGNSNAEIYYTTDGTSPLKAANSASAVPYNGEPISIDKSVVIKAIAILKEGGVPVDSSGIVKYAYTISSGSTVIYTITVDKSDGSAVSSFTVRAGEDITKEMLPDPVKEGYIFKNWVDADGNVVILPYEPQGNMKLTAVWTEESSSGGNPNNPGGDDQDDPNNPGGDNPGGDDSGDDGEDNPPVDPNADWRVEIAQKEYTYTGSAIQPAVTVYGYNNEKLIEGTDYTIKYSNNVNASVKAKDNGEYEVINDKKVPTITITGKGVITGKDIVNFEIRPKDISSALDEPKTDNSLAASKIIIEVNKKATPVICYNGIKLTTKDYTAETKSFKTVNENDTLNVTGKGNYEGTLTIPVQVVAKGQLKNYVNKFSVTVDNSKVKTLIYTGESLDDDILGCISDIKATSGTNKGKSIKEQTENYTVVLPTNTTDAGTVKFTVVGLGEYSGCSVSKSVKIQPKTIAASDIVITGADEPADYVSTGAVLSNLAVTWKDQTNQEPLENGKDYKVTYSGNKKAGEAKFTIAFKGNFKGKVANQKFTIKKAVLEAGIEGIKVVIPDKVLKNNASCQSAPYVTLDNVLVKASEYEVTYSVGDKDGTYSAKPKVTFGNDDTKTVYVRIKAKDKSKNYTTGKDETIKEYKFVTGEYTVWNKAKATAANDLSKAKVTFSSGNTTVSKFEYDGSELEPTAKVTIGSSNVTDKCEIIYVNNVNKGKATVIIKPDAENGSDLKGGKTASFSIVARNIKNNQFTEVFESVTNSIFNLFN